MKQFFTEFFTTLSFLYLFIILYYVNISITSEERRITVTVRGQTIQLIDIKTP